MRALIKRLNADKLCVRAFLFFERPEISSITLLLAILAVVLLSSFLHGCSSLGVPQPQTFRQKAALAYASIGAARDTTADLLEAKKITLEAARGVRDQLNTASLALDAAVAGFASDPKGSESKLASIVVTLGALQTLLQSKAGP